MQEYILFTGYNYQEVIDFLIQRKIKAIPKQNKILIDIFSEDIYIVKDDVVWLKGKELFVRNRELTTIGIDISNKSANLND